MLFCGIRINYKSPLACGRQALSKTCYLFKAGTFGLTEKFSDQESLVYVVSYMSYIHVLYVSLLQGQVTLQAFDGKARETCNV